MNKLDSALLYFHKALDFGKRINNQNRVAIANYNLGETYLAVHQPDSAKIYIKESYKIAVDKSYTSVIKDNLFMLSKIAEQENNTGLAFDYFKKATLLKDSLLNTDKVAKFTDLQIKHFTEQQRQENLLLRKNNEIQRITIKQQRILTSGLIISGLFILIILIYILYSRESFKKLNRKLEKSEKKLIRANADKDKFFTIIAHDLKSPFNGLIGITNILSSDFESFSTNEIKSMILALKESTTNIYQLLERLLEWSQIQTGKIEYYFEKIKLKNSGEEIIELFSTNAANKNIALEINIDDSIEVYADIKTISAILRNLIANAIKFTKTGGKITLTAVEKIDNIEISVSDTGIGMEQSTVNKLFNINEKVSRKGTAKETGTGLGLILCKEFAEKNRGKIWAESALGEGSKFTFTLPRSSSTTG